MLLQEGASRYASYALSGLFYALSCHSLYMKVSPDSYLKRIKEMINRENKFHMTRKEFIEVLEEKDYPYEIVSDKIVIPKHVMDVNMYSLETLPPGVVFKNRSAVYLDSLKSIPPGVEFRNGGGVFLKSLETLPTDVVFMNGTFVWVNALKSIPPGVEFRNGGGVFFESLIGTWMSLWEGHIKGIANGNKRLLNLMIKRGIFM